MFERNKNKNRNSAKGRATLGGQYGTFLTSPSFWRRISWNKKTIRAGSVLALFFVAVIATTAAALFNKDKKISEVANISIAEASEIPGWWYQDYFGSSVCSEDNCQSDADPDKDKLSNSQEFYYHTNPLDPHTVKDQLDDGELVARGFDPSKAGQLTFEEIVTEENLLGESLVLGKDIKEMVAESNDISKISLPLVEDSQLNIRRTDDKDTYKNYFRDLESTINKYFQEQDVAYIKEIIKSGSDAEVSDIKIKSAGLAIQLKTIPVPGRFVMFHKYNIALYELLSQIIVAPADLSSAEADLWYDKVQAFLAVLQRLDFEEQSLKISSQ